MTQPIRISGRQFLQGDRPVTLRAVTYGTFRPRSDGPRFPNAARSEVAQATLRLEGSEHLTALVVGDEMPADVVRWVGTLELNQLSDTVGTKMQAGKRSTRLDTPPSTAPAATIRTHGHRTPSVA